MSGITGVYGYNVVGRMHFIQLENATRALQNRGPDYHNTYHDNTVALGHRRLSIIDTSASGNQPMHDTTGRYLIIFDGEIFNYKALRQQLQAKGYSFRSQTDTEVLLNLYIDQGKECLQQVNGSFAFAIYDKEEKSLFIARDRMGIKPLYIHHDENKFIFASELKSILAFGLQKELDYESLWQYLQMNFISAPKTIFKKVEKLLPGHFCLITYDKVERGSYNTLSYDPGRITYKSFEELKKEFANRMEEAVQQRIEADVPVSTFLNGSIASSIITMLAARHKSSLQSFSIAFNDLKSFDEIQYTVAKKAGVEHTVFKMTSKDLLKGINEVLDYLDEPFADPSALATNILCRETKKYAAVALSGKGADLLFGSYNTGRALLRDGLLTDLIAAGRPLWYLIPKSRQSSNRFRELYRQSELAWLPPKERYWRWISLVNDKQAYNLLSTEGKANIDNNAYQQWKAGLTKDVDDSLKTQLLTNTRMVLPDNLLTKLDRMSMKNSLGIRMPFLDKNVVDFAFNLPDEYKMGGRKNVLYDSFRELLPADVYNKRLEKGFELPLSHWLRSDLKPMVNDLLDDDLIKEQGIFNLEEVKKLKRKLFSFNPGVIHKRIWGLVVFQYWYRKFF
jgi:asparagine synthase (glutamine-hydrolysing)